MVFFTNLCSLLQVKQTLLSASWNKLQKGFL